LHSAVLYKTWNFKEHARRALCNELESCGEDCLTNLTCLGGEAAYFGANFFLSSEQFFDDDGEVEPVLTLASSDCPSGCCRSRRYCMRVRDVLGYVVPFDTEMMLVFGGRTYMHQKNPADGKLIYHHCESIPQSQQTSEWRSCMELSTNDLWRYDITREKWDFIKTDSALDPATGQPVGYPLPRYGHGAVTIEILESAGVEKVRKVWMYIFGGLGPQCPGGTCIDVWKYEVGWASQAYFPRYAVSGQWNRGNLWYKLGDCPYGGRYRHAMSATSNGENIYVFGGQGIGKFYSDMLRYRVGPDQWESVQPHGAISLTWLTYDHTGAINYIDAATKLYDPALDVDCSKAEVSTGNFLHCPICPSCGLKTARRGRNEDGIPKLPHARGDAAMALYWDTALDDDRVAIFGGYSDTWGDQVDGPVELDFQINKTHFYANDLWDYDSRFLWTLVETTGDAPGPRRGHRILTIRKNGNDTLLLLFAGHYQDTQQSDLWVLDIQRPEIERVWTRIDQYLPGRRPPSISYHTMLYSEDLGTIIVFGGIHWEQTDLVSTDTSRDNDRRCFKTVRDLNANYLDLLEVSGEEAFLQQMATKCEQRKFCCILTEKGTARAPDRAPATTTAAGTTIAGEMLRNSSGFLMLDAVGRMCKEQCKQQLFRPIMGAHMNQGIWQLSLSSCLNSCSGHGRCELNQCVCTPEWYGNDCSSRRCPGSTCYTHPLTRTQFCVECSQRGRCVDGRCECFPGFNHEDCASVICDNNCSSTQTVHRGSCVEDFPVNQCVCNQYWSGLMCDTPLCPNACSGRGTCDSTGHCVCKEMYYGDDCSIFVFPIK